MNGTKTRPLTLLQRHLAELPTERYEAVTRPLPAPFTARIYNEHLANEARAVLLPGETPDALFVRLLLFYLHEQKQDSDTALLAAVERSVVR